MTYVAARTDGGAGGPLVFTFHGTGADEHQFHGLAGELMPGAHITSPRGDVSEMGHARYFRRKAEGVYDMADLARRSAAMADFIAAENARIEAPRVIGMGYSNGANILAAVAFERPDLVDELILMHPMSPWRPAPQPGLDGRRVLVTAGESDPICPAPQTRTLIAYLTGQGAEVAAHWHPGGHELQRSELEAIRGFLD